MSKLNVRIIDQAGHNVIPTVRWQTEAGATAIYAGEPVKLKAAASPYVIPLADAEPVIGTTTQVIGIAASDSNHTAAVDGYVNVYIPLPGVIYAAKAETASTADTQAEIDAVCGDTLLFNLGSGVYSIDVAAGSAATGGLQVVGGDPKNAEIYFMLRPAALQGAIA